jgi:hypothetical protein
MDLADWTDVLDEKRCRKQKMTNPNLKVRGRMTSSNSALAMDFQGYWLKPSLFFCHIPNLKLGVSHFLYFLGFVPFRGQKNGQTR